MDNNFISGKYFCLEKDNRFPTILPTGQWQNLTKETFDCPTGCSIYLLSGNNNLYVGSDGDGDRIYTHKTPFKGKYHSNYYMQNVVNKYGLEIFYYQPLLEIPQEYVGFRNQIENSYIKLFDTYNNGYNLCEFADTPNLGRKASKETKEKLSKIRKGRKSPMKGRKHSQETKDKIALWGKTHPHLSWFKKGVAYRLGRNHSKESREKISKGQKGKHHSPETEFKKGITPWNKGISHSEETKNKISLSRNGKCVGRNHYAAQKVVCIETNIIYETIKEASKDIGVSHSCIHAACNGKQKTSGGFHWKYA